MLGDDALAARRLRLVRHHRARQLRGHQRAVGRRYGPAAGRARRGARDAARGRASCDRSRAATTRRWRRGTAWPSRPTPMPAACSASPATSIARVTSRPSCSAALSVDGRLQRTWRDGQAKITGFSEDYGAVADGLIALHRATGELVWLDEARRLVLARRRPVRRRRRPVRADPARRRAAGRAPFRPRRQPGPERQLAASPGALLALARVYGDAEWEDRRDRGRQRRRPRSSTARRRLSATRSA